MAGEREHPRDLVAALDQARAALRDIAVMIADYRRQLVAAGMDSDDAIELCIELQRAVIWGDPEC